MWTRLCIISILIHVLLCKLIGEHICQEKEIYTVNVTEYFSRNATVRNYKWCMNVPPRCSFYTIRTINDTRTVARNETNVIEKCCTGYVEVSNQCVPRCSKCKNGKCENETCICNPGHTGNKCDEDCHPTRWGLNCSSQCECVRGSCNPNNGNCTCPPGWEGPRCDAMCPSGRYGNKCNQTCKCSPTTECDSITGECTTKQTTTKLELITELISTTSDPTIYSLNSYPKTTSMQLYTEKPQLQFNDVKSLEVINVDEDIPNNLVHNGNGRFRTSKNKMYVEITDIDTTPLTLESTVLLSSTKFSVSTSSSNYLLASNEETLGKNNLKAVDILPKFTLTYQNSELQNLEIQSTEKATALKSNPLAHIPEESEELIQRKSNVDDKNVNSVFGGANYLDDEALENASNVTYANNYNLINAVSGATAVIITVIVIALIILYRLYNRKTKIRKKEVESEKRTNGGVSTVSVYTHSIFHTPLPEPPTYQNPVYLSPIENENSTSERGTIETRVVCSMNFQNHLPESREYLYDHPPSTGSYRAASIPEPSEAEMNLLSTYTLIEPLYDEIPCRTVATPLTHSYKSSNSLYMNTCGKTRF